MTILQLNLRFEINFTTFPVIFHLIGKRVILVIGKIGNITRFTEKWKKILTFPSTITI